MARIWANRLEAGTQKWEDCPTRYKTSVKELLKSDVANGIITEEEYQNITDEPYEGGCRISSCDGIAEPAEPYNELEQLNNKLLALLAQYMVQEEIEKLKGDS